MTKKSVGVRIIEGLTDFRDALKAGEPLEKKFTIRTVDLDLKALDPKSYDQEDVRVTRHKLGVSQGVFAKLMGVSVALVQSWEQGQRSPQLVHCRVLDMMNRDLQYWRGIVEGGIRAREQEPNNLDSCAR